MNTTNLISTPNINGNIGSCTTNVAVVKGTRTLWSQEVVQVLTNSCDGGVRQVVTWELTGFSGLAALMGICGLILIGMFVVAIFGPKDDFTKFY